MASVTDQTLPPGFERTCWRGLEVGHPSDWEPGFLSALEKPTRCAFVDRRFQRLDVQWRKLPRQPDLQQMYKRIARTYRDQPTSPLVGAAGWEGLVRREEKGSVVHAGRYFESAKCLVEVVLVWPGRRDRPTELGVLDSIAPQEPGPSRRWRALGLSALTPAEFELVTADTQVGRVTWEFERPGSRPVSLTVERLAMSQYWLDKPLAEWLEGELPQGYEVIPAGHRIQAEPAYDFAGHEGVALHSRHKFKLRAALGRRTCRADLAWTCPRAQRVYRVGVSQRTRDEIDWPDPLEVDCCGPVRVAARRR